MTYLPVHHAFDRDVALRAVGVLQRHGQNNRHGLRPIRDVSVQVVPIIDPGDQFLVDVEYCLDAVVEGDHDRVELIGRAFVVADLLDLVVEQCKVSVAFRYVVSHRDNLDGIPCFQVRIDKGDCGKLGWPELEERVVCRLVGVLLQHALRQLGGNH